MTATTRPTPHSTSAASSPPSPARRCARRLPVLAASASALAIGASHLLRPDLDPSWVPISDHALGRHGWLMTVGFVGWGTALLSAAALLREHVEGWVARVGLGLLTVGGVGPLVAATFPADAVSTPTGASSLSGTIHGIGAVMGDGVPLGAALLALCLARRGGAWRPLRAPVLVATALTWAGAGWLTSAMATHLSGTGGQITPDTPVGWPVRAMVASYLLYAVVAAWAARRAAPRPGRVTS